MRVIEGCKIYNFVNPLDNACKLHWRPSSFYWGKKSFITFRFLHISSNCKLDVRELYCVFNFSKCHTLLIDISHYDYIRFAKEISTVQQSTFFFTSFCFLRMFQTLRLTKFFFIERLKVQRVQKLKSSLLVLYLLPSLFSAFFLNVYRINYFKEQYFKNINCF